MEISTINPPTISPMSRRMFCLYVRNNRMILEELPCLLSKVTLCPFGNMMLLKLEWLHLDEQKLVGTVPTLWKLHKKAPTVVEAFFYNKIILHHAAHATTWHWRHSRSTTFWLWLICYHALSGE